MRYFCVIFLFSGQDKLLCFATIRWSCSTTNVWKVGSICKYMIHIGYFYIDDDVWWCCWIFLERSIHCSSFLLGWLVLKLHQGLTLGVTLNDWYINLVVFYCCFLNFSMQFPNGYFYIVSLHSGYVLDADSTEVCLFCVDVLPWQLHKGRFKNLRCREKRIFSWKRQSVMVLSKR
jgi:hypothetical protein